MKSSYTINSSIVSIITMIYMASCCETHDDFIHMNDGNRIRLSSKNCTYYPTYQSFVENVNFNFPVFKSFISSSKPICTGQNSFELYGHEDEGIGWWEKATFGEWIEEYGLKSNNTYYCATIVYINYIDRQPKLIDYWPVKGNINVGYIPGNPNQSFDIDMNNRYPKIVFRTGVRFIGYKDTYNGIYLRIPSINNIIWKYSELN